MSTPVEFINCKKLGGAHDPAAMREFMEGYMAGSVAEYQMSAWLMAARLRGLSPEETAVLTRCIVESGTCRPRENFGRPAVDKHSTGGVGDKTTLVLLPLLASMGVLVPTLTGRGLGHTGGTVDKLESIPGLRQQFSWAEAQELLKAQGAAFMTQTEEVARLDKRLYALRDVTGTVDSVGLITASILGKKLAEGLDGLVLDVKYGSGAFMPDLERARELGRSLQSVAAAYGVRIRVLITDMNEPLGEWAGNAVEVGEAVRLLRGEPVEERFEKVTLALAAAMCQAAFPEEGRDWLPVLRERLASGAAYGKFLDILVAQGVAAKDLERLDEITAPAPCKCVLAAPREGYLQAVDTAGLGGLLIRFGGGRKVLTDKVDPRPALRFLARRGERLAAGQPIMEIYTREPLAEAPGAGLFAIGDSPASLSPLISEL